MAGINRLNARQVEAAKRKGKPYRMPDGGGLHLEIHPTGAKYWRLRYERGGKETMRGLGIYPSMSLADAREARDMAKAAIRRGEDPITKAPLPTKPQVPTFEEAGKKWFASQLPAWSTRYAEKYEGRLNRHLYPALSGYTVEQVDTHAVAQALTKILHTSNARYGFIETAHRCKRDVALMLEYAHEQGWRGPPPAMPRRVLPPLRHKHHPSITNPAELGRLCASLHEYRGTFTVWSALQIAPRVFVRPGELRLAKWAEMDLDKDAPIWRLPPPMTKTKRAPHIVPLATQVFHWLSDLRLVTGDGEYVFPGARNPLKPMSGSAINVAMRRIGWPADMVCGHGFRSTASTLLNEKGWHGDAIERQLHHLPNDEVRAAYNYAQHWDERIKMMQWWADYLDSLQEAAESNG